MKLSSFFELVRRYGIAADPRKEKRKITGYADSAILNGAPGADIRKILVGIDIDTAELLLADRIRQRGGLDLVMSHHPQGKALAGLYGVMQMQVDILRSAGIPESVAQGFLNDRRQQVMRRLLSGNHNRAVDSARALKLPFICAHTAADNHVFQFIGRLLARSKPRVVKDIVDILLEIPEYQHARELLCGPKVILGNPRRAAGKVLIEMTGGSEGSKDIYKHLYRCGVRTLVSMHLSEDHLKCVTDANLNVVIAGHISSDTLGMNLLLDNIEKHGRFDIQAISGFTRIKRRA
ncbi:MAG: NGG1p interacting factor NIF3 [Candidatus Omnitrophota bacterium]